MTREIAAHGRFNYLLSNGKRLVAHCYDNLCYILRHAPFAQAHLIDQDVTVDFSATNKPGDKVSVIATEPLTSNETWTRLGVGELIMFENGLPTLHASVPIPDDIRRRNAQRAAEAHAAEVAARKPRCEGSAAVE